MRIKKLIVMSIQVIAVATAQSAYSQTAYQPYTDYRMQPVMDEGTYQQFNGYTSPNTYNLGVREPRVVYTKNGLPMRVEEPRNDSLGKGTRFYLGLGYGFNNSFTGDGVWSQYDYYPENNLKSNGLGTPSISSFSTGAIGIDRTRIEVAATFLSGLSYGAGGITAKGQICSEQLKGTDFELCSETSGDGDLSVIGGGISSKMFGINAFLSLDEYTKDFMDEHLHTYIGGGMGFAFNTIEDFTIEDVIGFGETPLTLGDDPFNGNNFGYYDYDGVITHYGATTRSIGWNLEAGISVDLSAKAALDFYFKHTDFGDVSTSGQIVANYDEIEIMLPDVDTLDDNSNPTCLIPEEFEYNVDTGWCEGFYSSPVTDNKESVSSGHLATTELGVRLRLIF